jgi:hypothetical protein
MKQNKQCVCGTKPNHLDKYCEQCGQAVIIPPELPPIPSPIIKDSGSSTFKKKKVPPPLPSSARVGAVNKKGLEKTPKIRWQFIVLFLLVLVAVSGTVFLVLKVSENKGLPSVQIVNEQTEEESRLGQTMFSATFNNIVDTACFSTFSKEDSFISIVSFTNGGRSLNFFLKEETEGKFILEGNANQMTIIDLEHYYQNIEGEVFLTRDSEIELEGRFFVLLKPVGENVSGQLTVSGEFSIFNTEQNLHQEGEYSFASKMQLRVDAQAGTVEELFETFEITIGRNSILLKNIENEARDLNLGISGATEAGNVIIYSIENQEINKIMVDFGRNDQTTIFYTNGNSKTFY